MKNPLEPPAAAAAPDPAPDPERALVLSYAPADRRAGLAALLALDATLARIVWSARDPLIGQMRLTWWHGALSALDEGVVP
uniref:squalene/phytoene synthase family protein n=1 Tax=Sphingomonas bacterium TaxID=1895847 RepID=UPI0034A01D0A